MQNIVGIQGLLLLDSMKLSGYGTQCLQNQLNIHSGCFCECFFFNIIFLLVILEFHITYPNHTHFPILPCLPSTLMNSLPPKKKEKRKPNQTKQMKKSSFVVHILMGAWSNSQLAGPLKRTESFSTRTSARSHQLWRAKLQHPHHNF